MAGRSFAGLLDTAARLRPATPFLRTVDGAAVTYAEFARRRDAVAAGLLAAGHVRGRGGRVVLAQPTSVDALTVLFGVHRAGGVAVMANPAASPRELADAAVRTDAAAVLAPPALAEALRADPASAGRAVLDDGGPEIRALLAGSGQPPPVAPAADDPATILFTSGTTARPKAVLYRHGHHVFAGEAFARNLAMTADDLLMHHFPLFHMSGLGQVAATVTAASSILLVDRFRSGAFEELVDDFRPTLTFLNSTHVKMIRERSGRAPGTGSSLRAVTFALQLAEEHYAWFEDRFGPVLRGAFGMTETVTGCVMNPAVDRRRHSCGLPVPGYLVRVLDDAGGDRAPGEAGELALSCYSPYGLADGYLDDPAATEQAFRDGWLHTGDVVRRDADGYVFWLDRTKELIKRAGENISPAEVEAVLETYPGIAEVCVLGRPDPLREEEPIACVVPADGARIDVAALLAHCRRELAAYKVPAEVHIVASLPRNPVGKVVRRQLLAQLERDARGAQP